ncbi:uncharacterized protein LOC143225392 [Tachypleus tridentatus]|uniref:uncharacterized protein LOC143225392 n=1 Tax=Tachypleus tridentatus TaxID=6853 RepID=UPI003FD271DE
MTRLGFSVALILCVNFSMQIEPKRLSFELLSKVCNECQQPSELCCSFGNKKCCFPAVKPGFCRLTGTPGGNCFDTCKTDQDCEGRKKCCGGCGMTCIDPRG